MTSAKRNYPCAIFYMVLAYVSISLMNAFAKMAATAMPPSEVLFFRFLLGTLLILPFTRGRWNPRTQPINLRYSLLRNGAGLLSMLCIFYSLKHLPLSTATVLSNTAALFTPALMLILYQVKVSRRTLLCTATGFVGIFIIAYQHEHGARLLAVLVGLAGALFAAFAYIGIKALSKTHSSTQIICSFYLISTLALPVFTAYTWVVPSWSDAWILLLVGLTGLGFQIGLTQALKLADIGDVTPFIFTGVILSALLDWLLWNNTPGLKFWIGTAVIVAALSLLGMGRKPLHPKS